MAYIYPVFIFSMYVLRPGNDCRLTTGEKFYDPVTYWHLTSWRSSLKYREIPRFLPFALQPRRRFRIHDCEVIPAAKCRPPATLQTPSRADREPRRGRRICRMRRVRRSLRIQRIQRHEHRREHPGNRALDVQIGNKRNRSNPYPSIFIVPPKIGCYRFLRGGARWCVSLGFAYGYSGLSRRRFHANPLYRVPLSRRARLHG
jgi:hypothetical protein